MLFNLGDPLVGSRKKMKGKVTIKDVEYADDTTLVSESMDVLEEILRTLHTTYSGMGLSISSKKSKILAVYPSNSTSIQPSDVQLSSGEEPVAVVEDFEYLGSTIFHDCSLDQEISMCMHQQDLTDLLKPLQSAVMPGKTEDRDQAMPVQAIVLSTLLYGSLGPSSHTHKMPAGLHH